MLSAASFCGGGGTRLVSRKVIGGSSSSSSSSFLSVSSQQRMSTFLSRSTALSTPTTTNTILGFTKGANATIKSSTAYATLRSNRSSLQIRNFISRPDFNAIRSGGLLEPLKKNWKNILGGIVVGTGLLQVLYGNQDNYDDKRFILEGIDPDDLADFYGSENFMDLYNIFPFMATLMMRMGYFDDEGTVHTQGLPFGELLVSMVFSDSDDDDDEAGTSNGKWFNKRERFKNECFGGKYLMWDMMSNFGFETLPDGRCMVYHHGEYFRGNLPPLSLIMRLVFTVHSWVVIHTTKHHLQYYAFKNDTDIDEKMEHDSRDCMLLFWLMNYNPLKVLGYMLFDRDLDMPNHLKKKRSEAMVLYKAANPDEFGDEAEEEEVEEEEEEEDEEVVAIKLARKKTIGDAALSKTHTLPVQRPEVVRQISMDIAMDKAFAKQTLGAESDTKEEKDEEDEAVDAMMASKAAAGETAATPIAMAQKRATLRRVATSKALKRFQTSLNRGPATPGEGADEKVIAGLKRHATKIVKDFSEGNFTDPTGNTKKDNYKAVGLVARAKLVQRRATRMQRRSTALVRADKVDKLISFEIKKNKLDNAYGGYK